MKNLINRRSLMMADALNSPYSTGATIALMTTLPEKWPVIKEYGFQHPDIITYMNEYAPEDPKIAYSLVPPIGTRWITSSGGAVIDTGYTPVNSLHFKTKLIIHGPVKTGTQFVAYGSYDGSRVPISFYCPGGVADTMTVYHEVANVLGANASSFVFSKDAVVEIEVIVSNYTRTITQDGVTKVQNFTGTFGSLPIILFGSKSNSGYYMEVASSFSNTIIDNMELVPFIRNNINGMLDMNSNVFKQNASSGAFTISESSI